MINRQPPALLILLYTPNIKILDTPAEQQRIFYYYEQQLLRVYIYTISQVIGELALMWTTCSHVMEVASFPVSPHAQTKSQKKGETLVKFIMWEMPCVERDTLIRWGWTNALVVAVKAFWLTERDYTALHYITWQYGKLWWMYTDWYIQIYH